MEQHPHFIISEDLTENTVIWRYLSLTKFLSLITKKELYFEGIYKLIDKYEGSLPPGFQFYQSATPIGGKSNRFKKAHEQHKINIIQKEQLLESLPKIVVNCWTMHSAESYALWKIYTDSTSGIAIKSTIGRLKAAINKNSNVFNISKVYYGPHRKPVLDSIVTRKEKFYTFEEEVRLYTLSETESLFVPIETNELITEIYLSPFMSSYSKDAVRKIIKLDLESESMSLFNKIKESSIKERF